MNAAWVVGAIVGGEYTQPLPAVKNISNFMQSQPVET